MQFTKFEQFFTAILMSTIITENHILSKKLYSALTKIIKNHMEYISCDPTLTDQIQFSKSTKIFEIHLDAQSVAQISRKYLYISDLMLALNAHI